MLGWWSREQRVLVQFPSDKTCAMVITHGKYLLNLLVALVGKADSSEGCETPAGVIR